MTTGFLAYLLSLLVKRREDVITVKPEASKTFWKKEKRSVISFKTSDLNASGKVEFYTHLVANTTRTDLPKIPISLVASI